MAIRILTGPQIDLTLSMAEAIDVNAQAYAMVAARQTITPQRTPIETPDGVNLFMPSFLKPSGALAIKVVSVYEGNPKRGLPAVNAVVLAFDCQTGLPVGLLDGRRLTQLRTAAGAGAATRLLAHKDARVLAVFGAGGMAWDQVVAALAVRPIEEVRVYTPSGESAERLVERIQEEYRRVRSRAVPDMHAAARGADVITCITTSRDPVFDPADVSPGCHINGIGSFKPEMKEVPVWGLKNVKVFVDQISAVMAEAGEIMKAVSEGSLKEKDLVEIGDAISGRRPGRTDEKQITFFKAVGVAAQDAATAQAVLKRAEEMNLGTVTEF
jgi:ornithine cyclodeaminase/alanine dehydrogenase-like protein (mu-crystallin family)